MGVSTYFCTFLSFILAHPGCFVHSLTRYSLASFDNNPIERRLSLAVKPRQIRTAVRISRSVRSVPVHVEPVALHHLVDRLKDEERVVPQDHVELVHKDAVKDVVKDAVKEEGEALVAVVVLVAVAPKVAVVVGLLVPALATRISVETVPVVLGL
jgi:hypothetical protein